MQTLKKAPLTYEEAGRRTAKDLICVSQSYSTYSSGHDDLQAESMSPVTTGLAERFRHGLTPRSKYGFKEGADNGDAGWRAHRSQAKLLRRDFRDTARQVSLFHS